MIHGWKEHPAMHEPAYEKQDVHVRPILLFGVGLIVLAGIVLLLMAWMFGYFEVREERVDVPESPLVSQAGQPPPEPRLQVTPYDDLNRMRAEEDKVLNSYAWIDQPGGVARIPIARAMDLIVQKEQRK
jgi:hypothetical protein